MTIQVVKKKIPFTLLYYSTSSNYFIENRSISGFRELNSWGKDTLQSCQSTTFRTRPNSSPSIHVWSVTPLSSVSATRACHESCSPSGLATWPFNTVLAFLSSLARTHHNCTATPKRAGEFAEAEHTWHE